MKGRVIGLIIGIVAIASAGIYEEIINVYQTLPPGGSWTISRVFTLSGVYLINTTLPSPNAFASYIDVDATANYSVTITHGSLNWNYQTIGDEWRYTSIFNNQIVDGQWTCTVTNNSGSGRTWRRWWIQINYRPNGSFQQPSSGSYLRLNAPVEVITNGTQYARLWLLNLNTGQNFLLMPRTLNPNNDQGWEPWDIYYTLNTTQYPDGHYRLIAEIEDNEGYHPVNGDPIVEFYIDNTPPTIGPYNPVEGAYLTGIVLLQVNASDNMGLALTNPVQYQIDGGSWNNMTYNSQTGRYEAQINTTNYVDGSHTITYKATDRAGNQTLYNLQVYIDNTPPSGQIVLPVAGQYIDGNYTFKIQATDNLGVNKVTITFGGVLSSLGTVQATYNSQTGYFEYTVNTTQYNDGTANAFAKIYDNANLTYTTQTINFWVDNHDPTLQIVKPIPNSYLKGIDTLIITTTDANGIDTTGIYPAFRIDNGDWIKLYLLTDSTYTGTLNTNIFSDGQHLIQFRSKDKAGRISYNQVNIYIDNTPPSVCEILEPANNQHISGNFLFKVNALDNLGILRVNLKIYGPDTFETQMGYNPASGVYEYTLNTTILSEGEYQVKAIAYDFALNTKIDEINMIIDNTSPTAKITINPSSPVGVTTVSVTLITSEPVMNASLSYTPQGGNPIEIILSGSDTLWTGNFTVTTETPSGLATFSYSGTDYAGNVGHIITSGGSFLIDVIPPTCEIYLNPAPPLGADTIQITLIASESLIIAPVLKAYDGVGDSIYVSPLSGSGRNWTGIMIIEPTNASGTGFFKFTGIDGANPGNIGHTITFGGTFEINTNAPTAIITTNPVSPLSIGLVEIQVVTSKPLIAPPKIWASNGIDSIPMSGSGQVFTGTFTVSQTTQQGEGYFTYEGIDEQGNKGTVITSGKRFIIDRIPPTCRIILSKPQPLGVGPVGVTIIADEILALPPVLTAFDAEGKAIEIINLSGSDSVYTATMNITSQTASGTGKFEIQMFDISHPQNEGHTITQGKYFTVDTKGPDATITIDTPPVDTVGVGLHTVKILLSEPTNITPILYYKPDNWDSIRLLPQRVSATQYEAIMNITGETGDTRARFIYTGWDTLGNASSKIISGEFFYINVEKPIIEHDTIKSAEEWNEIVVRAKIHGTKTIKATLYYRKHNTTNYKSIEMVGPEPFKATIPAKEVTIRGIDYYIVAISEENKVAMFASPENPQYVKVYAKANPNEIKETSILTLNTHDAIDTTIFISTPYNIPTPSEEIKFTGIYFELYFPDTTKNLIGDLTIEIPYTDYDVKGMNEDMLKVLALIDDTTWKTIPTVPYPDKNIVKATISKLDKIPQTFILGEYYEPLGKGNLPKENVFCFPNPVKNGAQPTFSFYLKKKQNVRIEIFDLSGDLVDVIEIPANNLNIGQNFVKWDITKIPRGVYIYQIIAGNEKVMKKIAIIK
jgi:hypothetical protein